MMLSSQPSKLEDVEKLMMNWEESQTFIGQYRNKFYNFQVSETEIRTINQPPQINEFWRRIKCY